MQQQQQVQDQFKFNPLMGHVGTRFDANKGRRVAVTDESLLPKINQTNLPISAAAQAINPFSAITNGGINLAGINPQILVQLQQMLIAQ
jgi:hypothetical protein